MPIQVIVPEGVLTAGAEAEAFRKLTDLLLRLHGLTGNRFMTPNVIGEVTVVPRGRHLFSRQAHRYRGFRTQGAILRAADPGS